MNTTLIRRHAGKVLVGTTCVLLTAIWAGCTPPSGADARRDASTITTTEIAAVEPASEAPPANVGEQTVASADVEPAAPADEQPAAAPAEASADVVQVGSCDGEHTVTVSKTLTGQALADALMDQWERDHPEANWVKEEKEKHALPSPADNSGLLAAGQGTGHTYGNYTERDIVTWARETEKFVAEGSRIFHDGNLLGSTVSVSCDMCHPHAANTHPETYPKFQAQLGRVALLRDMINWCLQNPVRADKLDPDSPTMRALEAYIMAQRKNVAMNFGKH